LKALLKTAAQGISIALVSPFALLSVLGRSDTFYTTFAHLFALAPGIPGDYLRVAFYHLTLAECALSSRVQFGSYFAHREARVGPHVYIGSYCILGLVRIGENTQIASGVQVLSGRHQHPRDDDGKILGGERGVFSPVNIGANCWIGAGAIVMAEVGAASTIGAGSVVVNAIEPGSLAVGSPARVVNTASAGAPGAL
jgi:acetyltransferase-like isoleucine patch superfamily enzyme